MMMNEPSSAQRVETLLQIIGKASDDNQKFAALLVVSKLVKANELTVEERRGIFQAIGFSFPLRLISSEICEDKNIMTNLGFSILSSYVCDPALVSSPELLRAIPPAIKVMQENISGNASASGDNYILADCMKLLSAVATTELGSQAIIRNSGVECLTEIFCSTDEDLMVKTLIWNVLLQLSEYDADALWENNKEHMLCFLQNISQFVRFEQNEEKFSSFQKLNALLRTLPVDCVDAYFSEGWLREVVVALCDVLVSRINAQQRNPALKLCHNLTEKFGLKWTKCCQEADMKTTKFSVLLARLVCVEISMIIYEWSENKTVSLKEISEKEDLSLLLACFSIFEATCSDIADFDQEISDGGIFTFEEIDSLKTSLSDTVISVSEKVMERLLQMHDSCELVIACLRMVGSWLNVSIFAVSEVGLHISSTILSSFKDCLKIYPQDAIRSVAPAIMNYVEHSTARNVLLQSGIVPILCATLTNEERAISLESCSLVAQCLMALCLEVENGDQFYGSLPSLMQSSIKSCRDIAPTFYITTLALMVWNKIGIKSQDIPHTERFFKNVVNILHGIHTTNGSKIEVAKRYRESWNEIEELWTILIKEFIRSAQASKTVLNIMKQSGLPNKVEALLSYTSDLESEPASTYGLFNSFISTMC